MLQDDDFMRLALQEAELAGAEGEVPVGAVVVYQGEVIATGRNQPIRSHDPTAHAEIVALRAAAQKLGNYRLPDCQMYVTLEPCLMCAGAIMHARLSSVVFGALDLKTGVASSVLNIFDNALLNHHTLVQQGPLALECAQVLQSFFAERRNKAKQDSRCAD